MQMMQRRTAAAEHSLKKAELRVRSAELRAQSAESELAQLRKVHAVSAHAMCHCVCNMAAFSTAVCILSSMHQMELQMCWDMAHMQGLTFCSVALHYRKQSSSVQISQHKV